MAGERIGLFDREGVVPLGICLVVDLVKGRTTLTNLVGVPVPPAPLPLDNPLPKGSRSRLASKPVVSGVGTMIGNLLTGTLSSVLKGLLKL